MEVKGERQQDVSEAKVKRQRYGNKRSPMAKQPHRHRLWNGRLELEALQRINQALNSTLNLGEILPRIIAEVVSLLVAQSASVILHNDRTGEAELATN
jgi:hypothetical protein